MATQVSLPIEIWIRVLENYRTDQSLPEMWNSFRHVSTSFKQAIESIFRDKLLPKTWITFNMGIMHDDDHGKVIMNADFEFSHHSEDKITAVFKMDDCAKEFADAMRSRLRWSSRSSLIQEPEHTIQVRRDLTDGPIPGVSIDYEKFELSCNWRELYTIFYGEIELTRKLTGAWVKGQESWLTQLKGKMERGELDMENMMESILGGYASGSEDATKSARRARMRHQFREKGLYENWDPDVDGDVSQEARSLEKLKEKRFMIGFEQYSDDEDANDEDEDSDLETQSDDEMEDAESVD